MDVDNKEDMERFRGRDEDEDFDRDRESPLKMKVEAMHPVAIADKVCTMGYIIINILAINSSFVCTKYI